LTKGRAAALTALSVGLLAAALSVFEGSDPALEARTEPAPPIAKERAGDDASSPPSSAAREPAGDDLRPKGSGPPGRAEPGTQASTREAGRPAPPRVPPELQPPPREIRTLSRARVAAALAREGALERRFTLTRTVHDGHRLLKLGAIDPDGFYAELGLATGDVLMLVDGEWVTDQQNPLWSALADRDELALVVMRQGKPLAWRVEIE
jgi:hypothetical protein